eukprot:scaffold848_cov54-Attheya_sp.AAC.4
MDYRKWHAEEYVASPNIRRTVSKNPSDTGGHSNSSASETPSKSNMSEYTQQDVFERLQRTTTKAYTEKHRFDILAANSDHQSNNSNDPPKKPISSNEYREPTLVIESSDAISPWDKNAINGNNSGSETPSKSSMSEYTQQEVFERLQRMTTKAYTEKHRFDILAANSDHQSKNTNDPPKKPISTSEPREPTLVMECDGIFRCHYA